MGGGGGGLTELFLCGDVMLGRGIDQILPHPLDPALPERYVHDARDYVTLAESVSGPVPRPTGPGYPWGEALGLIDAARPDARVVNLETAVTRDDAPAPDKAVHYRMDPANLPALAVVRPDVVVLANNHVLDYGRRGLDDTLAALAAAGLRTAGAGRDAEEARRPAAVPLPGGRRLLVYAIGLASSGVPRDWAATARRGGVHFAAGPHGPAATRLAARLREARRPGDLVLVSVHWGPNWGYTPASAEVAFGHALIDAGADIVHGHSSHHPRPLEAYRGKLVLHGCGDLVNDYEGITGQERYRDDLRLLYLVGVHAEDGTLEEVRLVPLRSRSLRLERAGEQDVEWLHDVLDRISRPYGMRITATAEADGPTLAARPAPGGRTSPVPADA
ncbi:CapA family protein [Streptomyces sp. CC208A]|uniref:CapA family protein n=1 Tax=Streptomyces sp. CC208A TaxID=3044573 RepID=UPI0024AA001E|nr:CapA family protein [Streptomyces sp. CC208A]